MYCCEQKAPDNWFLDHLKNPIKTPDYEEYDSVSTAMPDENGTLSK